MGDITPSVIVLRKRPRPLSQSLTALPDSPFCRCATSSPGRGKSFLKGRALGIAGEFPVKPQSFRARSLPLGGAVERSETEGLLMEKRKKR